MVLKKFRLFVRYTIGGSPVSIVASTTSFGSLEAGVNSMALSQDVKKRIRESEADVKDFNKNCIRCKVKAIAVVKADGF
jgi:hypothetical protein